MHGWFGMGERFMLGLGMFGSCFLFSSRVVPRPPEAHCRRERSVFQLNALKVARPEQPSGHPYGHPYGLKHAWGGGGAETFQHFC